MELYVGTPKPKDPNSQNVARGLASDIKITFKNKTIIAQIQQPVAENPGNVDGNLLENPNELEERSRNAANSIKTKIFIVRDKKASQNKIQKKKKKHIKIIAQQPAKPAMNLPGPSTLSAFNTIDQNNYPKGIPRSFLRNMGASTALAPAPAPAPAPATQVFYNFVPEEDKAKPSKHISANTSLYYDNLELPDWLKTVENYESDEETVKESRATSMAEPAAGFMNDFNLDNDASTANNDKVGLRVPTPAKKAKMAINLLLNRSDSEKAREEARKEEFVTVPWRREVIVSKDEVVLSYTHLWPWKDELTPRRIVTAHDKGNNSIEFEKLLEDNDRGNVFIQVSVTNIPDNLSKQQVLEIIIKKLNDKTFVPCFIEMTRKELKFLVVGHRNALMMLYRGGLKIRHETATLLLELGVASGIRGIEYSYVTKVLKKKLLQAFDGETKLDLKAFCLNSDIMHFIYFPLNKITNQMHLRQLDVIEWNFLIELDLSENNLKSIDGFDLASAAPRLRCLNLANNLIAKVSMLLGCRGLSIKSLFLEGNPLCQDYYTDPTRYIRAVRLIFPTLKQLDGAEIVLPGELPPTLQNFCPVPSVPIVEKFLETFFPLLDLEPYDRYSIIDMYDEDCVLTVTHNFVYSSKSSYLRALFARSRAPESRNYNSVRGASAVAQLISRWPALAHDHSTFTVDVLHHSDESTVIRIMGAAKTMAETLADDEHVLSFTRTLVLTTEDGIEYKICNEMLYWEKPTRELEAKAFTSTYIKPVITSTKFESTPNDELKEKLVTILMATTKLMAEQSIRCLEINQWDVKAALQQYMNLVEANGVHTLNSSS